MTAEQKPWWKQPTLREALGRPSRLEFGGFVLEGGETLIYKKTRYPVAGAEARVESVGDIQRRITATRMLTTGVFAFAFKKKIDERELYLSVSGDSFEFVVSLDPKRGAEARMFAAQVTMAGKRAQMSDDRYGNS